MLFVLNVYSAPHRNLAQRNPLVILEDFNAQHSAWGYKTDTKKGRMLWDNAQSLRLTLLTDPAYPTRRGNSVQHDTTPDLTFVKNAKDATWTNTRRSLGSDHCILETTLTERISKAIAREQVFVNIL